MKTGRDHNASKTPLAFSPSGQMRNSLESAPRGTAREGASGAKRAMTQIFAIVMALILALGVTAGSGMGGLAPKAFAADAQPGQPAYYEARWAECVAKIGWRDTGLPAWNGGMAQPAQGAGTTADPYKVTTPEQFRWCLTNQKSCQLQNDLDLGGANGKNWNGIAASTAWTIDGNGHTVYNLYSQAANHTGLIAYSSHPDFILKNLTVSNAKVNSVSTYGAPLIAQYSGGQVLNCGVENALVWQDNAKNGVWAVMAGALGFGGNGTGGYNLAISKKVVKNTYTDNVHVYGGACSAGFIEAAQADTLVEDCYANNGTLIVPAGHSGGFGSCDTGPVTYKNCSTNIDVYGNYRTGVFMGVTHGGTHTFENCYASGKIEGVDTIGGFIGSDEGSAATTFVNCYSTSMVGMASGGKNMGGFAGLGTRCTFTNCYAAGEVGTLRSAEDGTPLGPDGNKVTNQNVTGFAGDNAGSLTNCFYDKQTTGMCDYGKVNGRVTGLLTRDLIAGSGLANVKDSAGNPVWTFSAGGYPELAAFSKSTNPVVRASSVASASTVHLYANADGSDYDTVRRIRYVFPLTNNSNSGRSDYDVRWKNYVGEDPAHPLYPNVSPILEGSVPIVSLSDVGTSDRVTSVAPGVGWLQVNAVDDATGAIGMRRLRLVPTTAIAMASFGATGLDNADVVTSLPSVDLEGMVVPEDQAILYDHRDSINFVTTTSQALNSFLLDPDTDKENKLDKYKITSVGFPEAATSQIDPDTGELVYDLTSSMGGDKLVVTLYKQDEDGKMVQTPWTPELEQLFSEERTATKEDRGVYQLGYEWKNSDGSVLKAQGTKTVRVVEPAYVVYHWNDGIHTSEDPGSDLHETYQVDPGCYLVGTSVGDKYVPVPERVGHSAGYWATDPEADFASDGTLRNEFLSTAALNPGRNDVYGVWVPNKHSFTAHGDDGAPIGTLPDVPYGTPVGTILEDNGIDEKLPDPGEVVGWTTTPGGGVVNVDDETPMPDNDLAIYPVRKAHPAIAKGVVNVTHPTSENNVGDLLSYTITASNSAASNSMWQNPLVSDKLPAGVSYVAGSLKLVAPDGTTSALTDAAYDEATHTITCKLPDLAGGQSCKVLFDAKINSRAIDMSDTPEGAANRDISNLASATGQGSDGTPIDPVKSKPVIPVPGSDTGIPVDPSDPDDPNDPNNPSKPGDPNDPSKPSGPAWIVVPYDPDPSLTKKITNITDPAGPTQVRDVFEVKVTATNRKADSVWGNVVISDPVPKGLQLLAGTIKAVAPDGTEVSLPDSAYDPKTGKITYVPGSIGGEQSYHLVYQALVTRGAVGTPLEFGPSSADGEDPHGQEKDVTSGDPQSPVYPTNDPNGPGGSGTPGNPSNPDDPNGSGGSGDPNDPDNPDNPDDPDSPSGYAPDSGVYWADPQGSVEKTAQNLTRPAEQTREGDVIRYEIVLKNPAPDSKWVDVAVFDQLPSSLYPDTSSYLLTLPDGTEVPLKEDVFDAGLHRISVYVGDIFGGETAKLSFNAKVLEGAKGADIGNVAYAKGGVDGPGPSWIQGGSGPDPDDPNGNPGSQPGGEAGFKPGDAFLPGFGTIGLPEDALKTEPVYPHDLDANAGVLSPEGEQAAPIERVPQQVADGLTNADKPIGGALAKVDKATGGALATLAKTGDVLGVAVTCLAATALLAAVVIAGVVLFARKRKQGHDRA